MKLTNFLKRLHSNTPDLKRFWQVDAPKVKSVIKLSFRKRGIPRPVLPEDVHVYRQQLKLEYNVMRCLSSPYLSQEAENAYHLKRGIPHVNDAVHHEEQEYQRMPNKPKVVNDSKYNVAKRGNIGNLLHEDQTVERMFQRMMQQRPFE